MNYYPHHIGDYKSDTAHLSLLEHGAYRQLLDWYYMDEMPIPKETDSVFRRLCARTEEDKAAILIVLKEFFILTDDGWIQDRCDREISAYRAKADRAKENGKLGGRPSKTKMVISRNLEETKSQANQEPVTSNQEPRTNLKPLSDKSDDCPLFDEFWKNFPRKEDKKKAKIAFCRLTIEKKNKAISDCVTRYINTDKKYIPHPTTYINGERWDDEFINKLAQKTPASDDFDNKNYGESGEL